VHDQSTKKIGRHPPAGRQNPARRLLSSHPAAREISRSTGLTRHGRFGTLGEIVMELRVHLKVCEGCGCLWFRVQAESSVYCASCHNRFKEFPATTRQIGRGRPRKITLPTLFAVEAFGEYDFALPSSGGSPVAPRLRANQARPGLEERRGPLRDSPRSSRPASRCGGAQ